MVTGLYNLTGGPKNGEMAAKEIENFLCENVLSSETQERLLAWKEELEFWERFAEISKFFRNTLSYRNLVRTMAEFATPEANQVWLDAGCGSATMSELIWEKSGKSLKKIIGIDIVLKSAREKIQEIPTLELKYGNLGERLEFNDETFDGIISNIAIPYVIEFEGSKGSEGMRRLFKELARVLKPGGQLVWSASKRNMHPMICTIVSFPGVFKNITQIFNLPIIELLRYTKELQRKGREGIYTYLLPREWDEILKEAGFVNSAWKFVFTHQAWVNKAYKSRVV